MTRTGNNPSPHSGVVVHVPHVATAIPDDVRGQFLLTDEALAAEVAALTDWYTDELVGQALHPATVVSYPVSRLVVDPERFPEDSDEPAAAVGMGVVYQRTVDGQPLRRPLEAEERNALLERFYRPHHRRLEEAVEGALAAAGRCLVLDIHSFPMRTMPTERGSARPDICLGTDSFHTPPDLLATAVAAFRGQGFEVGVDDPFSGALVPARYYRQDQRVSALMVEVARWLYMDEATLAKSASFHSVQRRLGRALQAIATPFRG